MMEGTSAAARSAEQRLDRDSSRPAQCGAMTLQSERGYDAAPQTFVRLTGSHLARPRVAPPGVTAEM